jgi:nicotinamidase-related amidase
VPELSHIDPRSAALLVMDYQVDTLTRFITAAQSADAIACVPDLIAMARDAGMMVIHVIVAFRPGHPEVSPRNALFSALMANRMMVAGSEGAAIHPAAADGVDQVANTLLGEWRVRHQSTKEDGAEQHESCDLRIDARREVSRGNSTRDQLDGRFARLGPKW